MIGIRGSVRNIDSKVVKNCKISKIMYAASAIVSNKMTKGRVKRFSPSAPIGGAAKLIKGLLKSGNTDDNILGRMMRGYTNVNMRFLWEKVIYRCNILDKIILFQPSVRRTTRFGILRYDTYGQNLAMSSNVFDNLISDDDF